MKIGQPEPDSNGSRSLGPIAASINEFAVYTQRAKGEGVRKNAAEMCPAANRQVRKKNTSKQNR